jgi:hypothetical protein
VIYFVVIFHLPQRHYFFLLGTEQLLVAQHPEFVRTWYNKKPAKVPKEYSAFDRLVFYICS